jgi:HK97 family phage portal protein
VGWFDALIGRRDPVAVPVRMVGFPSDGGLVTGGVTGTTALGLSAVWRCLDILSNGVSQLQWKEYDGPIDMLTLDVIVERPLQEATRREWVNYVVCSMALFDLSYVLRIGQPTMSLWPLDPTSVYPTTRSFSVIPFQTPEVYYVGALRVEPEQIGVIRRNPMPAVSDTLAGVLRIARIKFAEAIAADAYSSRYWQGGGSTQQYLRTEQVLPNGKAQELSDRWAEKRRAGPDHIPVMDGGIDLKDTGADPTQASAVEARRELVADIGRYFGIPTHTLNAPAGDSETYSSTESSNQDLVRYTLQNYIGAIEDFISGELPRGRSMQMDTWPLRAGTQLAQAQAYQLATGNKAWMSVDEVRERNNLGPVESPDELNPPVLAPVAGGSFNGG